MKLSREKIQRMIEGTGGTGGGSSEGDSLDFQAWANGSFLSLKNGGTVLGDTEFKGALTLNQENVATQKWVDNNYLSIDFFRGVFKVYAQNGEITPNNTNLLTAATNIKAMFGFWTESYISALGRGNGQAVIVSALNDLSDVNLSSPQNGQVLTYNYQTGKWVNSNMPSLTGYATKQWVQDQGYLTQHQSLAGYATQSWVGDKLTQLQGTLKDWTDNNYVSIAFFRTLFRAYNAAGNAEITPNHTDLAGSINNIKAMFGFWTESYISALGRGNGQAVIVSALNDLSDVNLSSPQNGQVLTYNYQTGKWVNSNMPSLTGYATQSWVQDQGYLTQHQSLAGYATQSWVNNKGYATETWVNNKGYATETWVGQNYLGLHATADAATKLATARTIWGQSFNGTANVSGNMSSVGNITMDGNGSYRISPNGMSIYIGNVNNSGWVYLADMCSQSNTSSVTYWKIMNNGNSEFANVLSNGYVTALSDIRFKDVINRTALSLEAIASASLIRFTWKERDDKTIHVGGIAQEWENILPEAVVKDADGRLTMDYGVIGMVAAVSLAREMQDQQAKIASLEERIARLESMLGL